MGHNSPQIRSIELQGLPLFAAVALLARLGARRFAGWETILRTLASGQAERIARAALLADLAESGLVAKMATTSTIVYEIGRWVELEISSVRGGFDLRLYAAEGPLPIQHCCFQAALEELAARSAQWPVVVDGFQSPVPAGVLRAVGLLAQCEQTRWAADELFEQLLDEAREPAYAPAW